MKQNAHIFVYLYQIHAQTRLKHSHELCLIFWTEIVGDEGGREGGRKQNLHVISPCVFLKGFFFLITQSLFPCVRIYDKKKSENYILCLMPHRGEGVAPTVSSPRYNQEGYGCSHEPQEWRRARGGEVIVWVMVRSRSGERISIRVGFLNEIWNFNLLKISSKESFFF